MALTEDEYYNQGTKKLEQYIAAVNSIISLIPEPRRSLLDKMMKSELGSQFMTAPASTKRGFHNAFPCGLVAHSIDVVSTGIKIANLLYPNRWPTWKIAFCCLFHDFGKAGSPGKPYYVPVGEDWKRKKGEFFDVSQEEWMPNSQKSLYNMQISGIVLDYEETVAILLNDGAGPVENKQWGFHTPDLALVVHWADHRQMLQEKAENKQ